jgi:ferrous iron transport protein B
LSCSDNSAGGESLSRPGGDVLVIGALQSGKTALFRRLCGERTREIGLAGSSRSLTRGRLRPRPIGRFLRRMRCQDPSGGRPGSPPPHLIDSPGTATLFPQDEEELLVRDALLDLRPAGLLVVVDARSMRRSLALLAHAAELELPTVLAVNMQDEARRRGVSVDCELLGELLGIDAIPTVASQGTGLDRLAEKLPPARVPRRVVEFPARVEPLLEKLVELLEGSDLPGRYAAGLLLAGGPDSKRRIGEQLGDEQLERARELRRELSGEDEISQEVALTEALYAAAADLDERVVDRRKVRRPHLETLGHWAQHPLIGLPIAAAAVAAMYFWVGELGATLVVDWIDAHVFGQWLIPLTERAAAELPWPLVRDALVDPDFGLLPTGLFLAFGLVLPVLFFFYFGFQLLVESGYLPRLSILLDRVFRLIGLNGRGILPLTMGFSCVTMALITTRMLPTRRERTIASLLLVLATPCAPLLSVMLVVLADLPLSATLAVFGTILTQTLLAGFVADRILPGRSSDFIMEIPPLRIPSLRNVLVTTARQTWGFMKEAVPLFMLASLVLFTIDRLGGLAALERASEPVVRGGLGLPPETVQVFIKSLIRRESGAAELAAVSGGFDNLQLVVTLVVMTFLTPCVNAVFVLVKERGLGRAAALVATVSVYALLLGTALNWTCHWLGITFS